MNTKSLIGSCGLYSRLFSWQPVATSNSFTSVGACPRRHNLRQPQSLAPRGLPLLAPYRRLSSKPPSASKHDAEEVPSPPTTSATSNATDSSEGSHSSTPPSGPPSSEASPSTVSPPNSDAEQPKPSPPPRRSDQSWFSRLSTTFKALSPWRLLINIAVFTFLMRFLPLPGISNSPLSQPDGVVLRISFSEFIKSVRKNEVSRVVVDGNHLMYALNPSAQMFKGPLKNLGIDQNKVTFETVRPTDYPTPYDTMITNNVQISALEKKGSLFSTLLVRSMIPCSISSILLN